MRRRLLSLLGLVLAAGLVVPGLRSLTAAQSVYTVPQIMAALALHPRFWVGQTVLVRGTALDLVPDCPRTQWCASGLYAPNTPRPGPLLLLEPGPANSLVLRLRRLPFLNALVPGPQRLRWHRPATYRLLVTAVPGTVCDGLPCINVLLVDPAPQMG